MGRPKGRLLHEGSTLVERAVAMARATGLTPVLVGDASPYADLCLDVPRCSDEPAGVGPLGGLRAVLRRGPALALACDMPYVTAASIRRLQTAPGSEVLVAERDGRFEPLFARYEPSLLPSLEAYLAEGQRAFQPWLRGLDGEGRLSRVEMAQGTLRDWDRPADLHQHHGGEGSGESGR